MLNIVSEIFIYVSQLTFYSLNISSIVGKFIVSTLSALLSQCTDFFRILSTAIGIFKEDFETFSIDVYGKLSFAYTSVATAFLSIVSAGELLALGFCKTWQLLYSGVWNVIYKNYTRLTAIFVFIKNTLYLITEGVCFVVNSIPELVYFSILHFQSASYEAWLIVCNLYDSLYQHFDDIIIGTVLIVCFGALLHNCTYLMNFLRKCTVSFIRKISRIRIRRKSIIKKSTTKLDLQCVICHENDRSILLIPCRHLCLCDACWNTFRNRDNHMCPLCRSYIQQHMKIFT